MAADAFIYDAARTPRGRGKVGGSLYKVKPVRLLATALYALATRNHRRRRHGHCQPLGEQGSVVANESAMLAAARAWIHANPKPTRPWERQRPLGTHNLAAQQRGALVAAPGRLAQAHDRAGLAARRTLEVAAQALYLDFDTALRIETRALTELLIQPEATAAIKAFFARPRHATVAGETGR